MEWYVIYDPGPQRVLSSLASERQAQVCSAIEQRTRSYPLKDKPDTDKISLPGGGKAELAISYIGRLVVTVRLLASV